MDFWDLKDLKKCTEISKKVRYDIIGIVFIDIVDIVEIVDIVDIIEIVNIVDIIDTVDKLTLLKLLKLLTLLTLTTLSNDVVVAIWNKNRDGFWGYASISKTWHLKSGTTHCPNKL